MRASLTAPAGYDPKKVDDRLVPKISPPHVWEQQMYPYAPGRAAMHPPSKVWHGCGKLLQDYRF